MSNHLTRLLASLRARHSAETEFHPAVTEVDNRLSDIMKAIPNQCVRCGEQDRFVNYVDGDNLAGFRKVAEAMLDQGIL